MNSHPQQQHRHGFSIVRLTLATVAFTLLLAIPAYYFTGRSGLEGLTLSAFLCLAPGWLVFLIYKRYGDSSKVAIAFLIGSGFRMACALAGFLYVELTERYSSPSQFVVWLLLIFLFTLLLEAREAIRFLRDSESGDTQNYNQH
ncbi:MAG: hypothetical protein CMJ46_11115 [Planctomyces sp.]|nr:hypothetical protein [Planctomyces sp.]